MRAVNAYVLYFTDDQVHRSKRLKIKIPKFPVKSNEQLQDNEMSEKSHFDTLAIGVTETEPDTNMMSKFYY